MRDGRTPMESYRTHHTEHSPSSASQLFGTKVPRLPRLLNKQQAKHLHSHNPSSHASPEPSTVSARSPYLLRQASTTTTPRSAAATSIRLPKIPPAKRKWLRAERRLAIQISLPRLILAERLEKERDAREEFEAVVAHLPHVDAKLATREEVLEGLLDELVRRSGDMGYGGSKLERRVQAFLNYCQETAQVEEQRRLLESVMARQRVKMR